MSQPDVHIEPTALTDFIREIFTRIGSSHAEAEAIATSLVETSLMGHDSHGVSIVPRYVERALDGRIAPNRNIVVVKNEGPVLIVDGEDTGRRSPGRRWSWPSTRREPTGSF